MSVYIPVYRDSKLENDRLKLLRLCRSPYGTRDDTILYLQASGWKKNPSGSFTNRRLKITTKRSCALKRQYKRDEESPKPRLGVIKRIESADEFRRRMREQIISMALDTNEGRRALAEAMVEPIKTGLMYQGLGRKLLLVDELPEQALPRYERDVQVRSILLGKRGGVPTTIAEGEELLVPTVEIASNPTIRRNEIRQRRFYVVDRASVNTKDSLNHALTLIESNELIGAKIVLHPQRYKDMIKWAENCKKKASPKTNCHKRRKRNGQMNPLYVGKKK